MYLRADEQLRLLTPDLLPRRRTPFIMSSTVREQMSEFEQNPISAWSMPEKAKMTGNVRN